MLRRPIPLLDREFSVIAKGPCEITFTNSSRQDRVIEYRIDGKKTRRHMTQFSQAVLRTESGSSIEARQIVGRTVSYDVKAVQG